MKCQNCGAPVEIKFNLCPYCGASLEEAVSADDVYNKIDGIDDKLDDIHDHLKTNQNRNNTYQSQPQQETSSLGKVAQVIFFIVFITIFLMIFTQACRMFTNPFGMGF